MTSSIASADLAVRTLSAFALLALGGCGADGEASADATDPTANAQVTVPACQETRDAGSDAGGATGEDGGAYTAGTTCNDRIAPTSANVASIVQRSCGLSSSCHAGISAQAGLDLSTLDALLRTAVDRPSAQLPELSVIAPGNPEQSYLLRKLRNLQTVGTSMPPPPSARLCDAKLTAIEAWIRDGAKH